MKNAEEIFELVKKEFGDSVLGIDKETPTEPIISVDPLQIHKVGTFLRDNEELKFDSLMCLSGVDDADGTKEKDEQGLETITGRNTERLLSFAFS